LDQSFLDGLHVTAAWTIRNILKDSAFADAFSRSKHSNLTEYWRNIAAMKDMNKDFYAQVWDKYAFDVILAPGMSCPALPHGATNDSPHWQMALSITMSLNHQSVLFLLRELIRQRTR